MEETHIAYLTVHLSGRRELFIVQDDDGDWSVAGGYGVDGRFANLCDDLETLLHRIEEKADESL
jgi:hypothetical protein